MLGLLYLVATAQLSERIFWAQDAASSCKQWACMYNAFYLIYKSVALSSLHNVVMSLISRLNSDVKIHIYMYVKL